MIKGVNRQVVEVSQPNSQYFERILYIVKPEFSDLNQSKLMNEANKLNQSGEKPPKFKTKKSHSLLFAAIAVLAVAAIIITFTVLAK